MLTGECELYLCHFSVWLYVDVTSSQVSLIIPLNLTVFVHIRFPEQPNSLSES